MTYVNPTKTSVFLQTQVGELPRKLPQQTIVTASSGGGYSFDSDYAQKVYKATRFTANAGRFTFNLQTRREAISALRDMIGKGLKLFNLIVLESDTIDAPGFDNFSTGYIYRDCGATSLGLTQDHSNTTGVSDPKQMDTIGLSAGERVEIHPLQISADLIAASGLAASGDYRAVAYSPDALTNYGATELTLVAGRDGLTTNALVRQSRSKGDQAFIDFGVTGIPAATTITGIIILGNRAVISTNKGIYHTQLSGSPVWFLANGVSASDVVNGITALDSGLIIAFTNDASGEFMYSHDQGFSFTTVLPTIGDLFIGVLMTAYNLIWFATNNNAIVRVRGVDAAQEIVIVGDLIGGEDITALATPPGRPDELYAGTSTGRIFKTKNASAPSILWEELFYPRNDNANPRIDHLAFSPDGLTFWINYTVSEPYLIVDYSGGYAGASCSAPIDQFSWDLHVHSPTFALGVGVPIVNLVK